MKTLKVLVLILAITFFTVTSFIFIAGRGVERTLLNEKFYERVFEEANLAAYIGENTLQFMARGAAEDLGPGADELLLETLDEQWIEQSATTAAANFIAWLKGERESALLLDISEKRRQLTDSINEHLQEMSNAELTRLDFTATEITQIRAGRYDAAEDLPPEISVFDLSEEATPAEVEEQRQQFQANYERYRLWTPIVLVLLIATVLMATGVFRGLKWIGGIMMFAGLLVIIAAYISRGILTVAINATLTDRGGADTPREIVSLFINNFTRPALLYAFLGLVLLIIGILGRRIYERKKSTEFAKNPTIV